MTRYYLTPPSTSRHGPLDTAECDVIATLIAAARIIKRFLTDLARPARDTPELSSAEVACSVDYATRLFP